MQQCRGRGLRGPDLQVPGADRRLPGRRARLVVDQAQARLPHRAQRHPGPGGGGGAVGRGRRAGIYGALLLAVYDPAADRFQTICKCGTGFSDAELAALPARLAPLVRAEPPARVDTRRHADVWFEPALVVEVLAAELTLSPTHTAAWDLLKEDSGLALRFPRFSGRWRDDKAAEDATTVEEVVGMFRAARRAPAGA